MAHSTILLTALLGLSISLASSGCAGQTTYESTGDCATLCADHYENLTMETYTPTPTKMVDVSLPQAGIDPIGVSTVRTGMEAIADGLAYEGQAASAWLSLSNTLTVVGDTFEMILKSSYPSGAWTMVASDHGIEVPAPGLYRVDFVSLMDSADDTSYLEVEAEVGVAVGSTAVGYFQGFRYGDNAAPAQVVGWIEVAIATPSTERLFFTALNGTSQTPQVESSVGRLHKILITRLGDL